MADYDPLDKEALNKAKVKKQREAKNTKDTEEDDFIWLMGNKRGRRIVWGWLNDTGIYRSTFSTTAMQMAFNEGFRNFGLCMMAKIQMHCPDQHTLMVQENTK